MKTVFQPRARFVLPLFFLLLATLVAILVAGKQPRQSDQIFSNPSTKLSTSNYVGGDIKGNYIWAGAMNLAWQELIDSVVKEPLRFNSTDPQVLAMVDAFNNPPFGKGDMNSDDYYVKSGVGSETVATINRETRAKFPDKSFKDLDPSIGDGALVSYAYFLKVVEYVQQFTEQAVQFDGQMVKGFVTRTEDQRNAVRILSYSSDDQFIVALRLKQSGDELILAKGYPMSDPTEVVEAITNSAADEPMAKADIFTAPKIKLEFERSYDTLLNTPIENEALNGTGISVMREGIKFEMDHVGARVENEALMAIPMSASIEKVAHKQLLLDKPYWVVMKESDSVHPYFLLGVNNTQLMEREAP